MIFKKSTEIILISLSFLVVPALIGFPSCMSFSGNIPREKIIFRACPPDGYVDRIEGQIAIIELHDGNIVECEASGLMEADVLRGGFRDPEKVAYHKKRVKKLLEKLHEEDSGEDLDLF